MRAAAPVEVPSRQRAPNRAATDTLSQAHQAHQHLVLAAAEGMRAQAARREEKRAALLNSGWGPRYAGVGVNFGAPTGAAAAAPPPVSPVSPVSSPAPILVRGTEGGRQQQLTARPGDVRGEGRRGGGKTRRSKTRRNRSKTRRNRSKTRRNRSKTRRNRRKSLRRKGIRKK